MSSWERVDFFNRYFAGTVMPRVFLDWLPGLGCSAHFALIAAAIPKEPGDYVAAGRATQRFWLTATRLGFQVQPLYTPLVFANFARQGRDFTVVEAAKARARAVAARLDRIFGAEPGARCSLAESARRGASKADRPGDRCSSSSSRTRRNRSKRALNGVRS